MSLISSLINRLPDYMIFMIIIFLLISLLIVSLKGNITFKGFLGTFGIGSSDNSAAQQKKSRFKRTCGDCILILMAEREKLEYSLRNLQNQILKSQMNYVEQKLISLEINLTDSFLTTINNNGDHELSELNTKNKEELIGYQYKIYNQIIKNCLDILKDEFRRSFKENGLSSINELEFSYYLKDRVNDMKSLFAQNFRNMCGHNNIGITFETAINDIEKASDNLKENIKSIYIFGRQTELDIEDQINIKKDKFKECVNGFVGIS